MNARAIYTLVAGAIFGVGLSLSQMADPHKVLAFLDIVGPWDPSLALVMGGAVLVFGLAYIRIARWPHPWFESRFHLPSATRVDRRLAAGAALFGIGWGLAGYCPGPGITALWFNPGEGLLFVPAVIAGGLLVRGLERLLRQP